MDITQKRKVILVYPKLGTTIMRRAPLSVLCLGAYLEQAGFIPIIIDIDVAPDWQNLILSHAAEAVCVGISSLTGYQIHSGLEVTNFVKENFPKLPVIWGGVHPTLLPVQTLEEKNIDVVVRGEGEATLLELVNCLKDNKPIDNILGISFKKNGQIINNFDRQFLDINTLPDPAWHLVDLKKYTSTDYVSNNTIPLQTTRGCPHRCTYCYNIEFNKKSWRAMSPEKVFHQVDDLIKKYNIDGVAFCDDNFFVDFDRVKKICHLFIDNKLNIKWEADCRIDYLFRMDEEFFKLLKAAGLQALFLGAESGSPRILDFVKKDITVEQIIASAELTKKYDLAGWYAFILGLPSEKPEDVAATIKIMKKVKEINPKAYTSIKIFSPFVGSPLFNISMEYGFAPPLSLEKWSEYTVENDNTPWPKHKFSPYFSTCTYFATEYDRLKNFIPGRFLKILGYILHLIEKFRWDHEFWFFPIELMAVKKVMKKL